MSMFHFETGRAVTSDGRTVDLNRHADADYQTSAQRVICLCPTWEARREWLPLVLAQFDAQTHANRVLVIADSNADPATVPDGVQYLHMPGASLPHKRNTLLRQVKLQQGDWFVWWDDDELRDVRWLEAMLSAWDGISDVLTPDASAFVDAYTLAERDHPTPWINLQSSVYAAQVATYTQFPEQFPEDLQWVQAVAQRFAVQTVDGGPFLWNVAHGDNLWNTWQRVFGAIDTPDYAVKLWHDKPLYCCKRCHKNTIDKATFLEHMFVCHQLAVRDLDLAASPPQVSSPAPRKRSSKKGDSQ